ncbi:LOW QUALITY PROTEIN: lipase 3 [Camponotus floridanus]|uniref:LOW QUALITY PROTEIN: lipase 3 n=1 Tax=Camponotus floridanus TaxID=104421 RepID=UPI000DC6D046|nr:LOW QUALITY PROTEIN: lipase 3 [Camponotus floridanus]
MIRKAGYPAESHVIMTEDGYLLTLHHIPGGNNSLPVLLQHGFYCSSADWVVLGKGKALAYILADEGYDVWLGNFRGNTYSKAHISLSPLNSTFWNFSFFTMASERPKISKMVQMMIALAPAVFIKHMRSPAQYLKLFRSEIETVMRLFFHDEFLQNDFVRFLLKKICLQNINRESCSNFMFIIWGDDYEQFNNTLLPVILNHFPTSASTKTLLHYAQIFDSDKFRKFDYGRVKNLLIYNSMDPPNYNLSNTTAVPIALFYADNDWLIDTEDVKRLYHLLPNVVDMYDVPWSKFNHFDFMWAKDASKLVYDRIIKIMRRENPNNITSVE